MNLHLTSLNAVSKTYNFPNSVTRTMHNAIEITPRIDAMSLQLSESQSYEEKKTRLIHNLKTKCFGGIPRIKMMLSNIIDQCF